MINGNGFISSDGVNGSVAPWMTNGTGANGTFPAGSPGNTRWGTADAVRPAWVGGSSGSGDPASMLGSLAGSSGMFPSGNIASILGQLSTMVAQYIGRLGAALTGSSSTTSGSTSTTTRGNATSFQNVTLGSTGDPHLAATGTALNSDGTTASVNTHYDSMTGHDDLFSTRDFGDGFRVATAVTQPAANGVTYNASATASMNGGSDSVTMGSGGAISVTSGGSALALSAGQTLQLSGGATVSEAANGAVSITESRFGENLTTTFSNNGNGIDVSATGTNVTLAGDIINKR